MGTIRVVDAGDAPWESRLVEVPPAAGESAAGSGYEIRMCVHHEGDDALPRLHEIEQPPGNAVIPHAHDCDEIIYVVEGELILGSRVLRAGSSVFVPANTLYAFRAGPTGLRFLNFRPHGNVSSMMKDEFLRSRAGQPTPSEAAPSNL